MRHTFAVIAIAVLSLVGLASSIHIGFENRDRLTQFDSSFTTPPFNHWQIDQATAVGRVVGTTVKDEKSAKCVTLIETKSRYRITIHGVLAAADVERLADPAGLFNFAWLVVIDNQHYFSLGMDRKTHKTEFYLVKSVEHTPNKS